MPQVYPVRAPRSLNRAMMHGECYSITLAQWHYLRSRLHARTLFGEHKFAAGEIPFGFRKEECHLDRENMLSIKILVKAVVIARSILQKQGSGTKLSCIMASLHEVGSAPWDSERPFPSKRSIGWRLVQAGDKVRFAAPEPHPATGS